MSGKIVKWKYSYDKAGRLQTAHLDGRLICQCQYDKEGRRTQDYFPATAGSYYRDYRYTVENRLQSAGDNTYTHDKSGFRSIWSSGGRYTLYEYAPDYRLLKMEVEGEDHVFEFSHDDNGQRETKFFNGQMVEAYKWLDFTRLAGFHDGQNYFEFAYEDEARTPHAMRRDDGAVAYLFYDQVGSLRVVADMDGNVIKEVLYDPFGGIIEDTNPDLSIPVGFAGGLHDRDLGFVRFGWRDYDTKTSRWTAPDPMGDAGGDSDWYGYCLDDPVNGVDSLGLYDLPWYVPRGKARDALRDSIGEFGYKSQCTDEQLDGLIDFVPEKTVDDFKRSYEKRPDSGTKTSKKMDMINRKEYQKEKKLVDETLILWGEGCFTPIND